MLPLLHLCWTALTKKHIKCHWMIHHRKLHFSLNIHNLFYNLQITFTFETVVYLRTETVLLSADSFISLSTRQTFKLVFHTNVCR